MPINESPPDLADSSFRFKREEELELYNPFKRFIGKGVCKPETRLRGVDLV